MLTYTIHKGTRGNTLQCTSEYTIHEESDTPSVSLSEMVTFDIDIEAPK